MMQIPKFVKFTIGLVVGLILFLLMNPFAWNDATERTVVTTVSGGQFVQYKPGLFWSGIFARETTWPNQISVSYTASEFNGDLDMHDNTVEIGKVIVRFNDATEANVSGITQYILPNSEKEMLEIHNAHRTPEALVQRRLAPYTKECLQSSSQLLSSEMHYSGGRAQMVQDYLDQLRNGTYLLNVKESNILDSTDNTQRRIYTVTKQLNKNGTFARKFSSIKEYNILLGDAQITNTDYSEQVQTMLRKKIDAATQASISKQRLMTAEQQKLTAKAEGEKKLTEIEYQQKQEQTVQVVKAQTQVEVAKQDKLKQQIAYEAAILEAKKVKELADGEAYARAKIMNADGALDKKLATYERVTAKWAEAFQNYGGNVVPLYQFGGSERSEPNGATTFMQLMNMKTMQDMSLDPNVGRRK